MDALAFRRRRGIRKCEARDVKSAQQISFHQTFRNFLSEMRRRDENVARPSTTRARRFLCIAGNLFTDRRLVHLAHFLRCAGLDAAMQHRSLGTYSEIGVDFEIEQAQHQADYN
jgi:hypothetical protein